jgi:hypothetical protein
MSRFNGALEAAVAGMIMIVSWFLLSCGTTGEQEALEFVVETLWDDKRPPLGFHHAWQV